MDMSPRKINKGLASVIDGLEAQLFERDDEVSYLKGKLKDLQQEILLLTQCNNKRRKQIDENLNESTSMETSFQDENAKLVNIVYNLKMENMNLNKEILDLKWTIDNSQCRSSSPGFDDSAHPTSNQTDTNSTKHITFKQESRRVSKISIV